MRALAGAAWITTLLLVTGCRATPVAERSAPPTVDVGCKTKGDASYYLGTYDGPFIRQFLPTLLSAAEAESLRCDGVEAFRLGYVPTQGPAFIITVSKSKDWSADAVELANLGAAQSFKVIKRVTNAVPPGEVAVLSRALERAEYARMAPDHSDFGADGAIVAIEVSSADSYRVVQRIGPLDGPFLRAAMIFFELAALPYPGSGPQAEPGR